MNDYELVAILNPEIKDEDVGDTVDRISQYIGNRGGEVQNIDQWGRRRLAYPIARQFEGTYVVTHLRLPPANAAELEANLRISEDVIRHLLVRYSPAEQAAAIAASQRRRPRPFGEEGGERPPQAEAAVSAESPAPPSESSLPADVPAASVEVAAEPAADTPVEATTGEAAVAAPAVTGADATSAASNEPVAEATVVEEATAAAENTEAAAVEETTAAVETPDAQAAVEETTAAVEEPDTQAAAAETVAESVEAEEAAPSSDEPAAPARRARTRKPPPEA